jgi:zinc transport system substrate-binding protein
VRAVVVAVTAVLALTACGRQAPPASGPGPVERKVAVVASFYPLYEFARRVGGDHAEVRNLVPAGAEPHDYEPTPQDVAALHTARVVVYNGAGFEPWLEKLLPGLPAAVEPVNATDGLPLVTGEAEHGHERESRDGASPPGGREGLDPHVWLDPVLARRQVDLIAAAFARVDPTRRETYEANAAALRAELAALDERYRRTLAACRKKTFITSHAAFGYLAARYGLTMVSISGLSPDAEPSAARLRAVVREARARGATVIYFETLVSPRVAETIAREVRAKTAVLNPIEGLTADERAQGATYFTVMDANLRNLADGLDCR